MAEILESEVEPPRPYVVARKQFSIRRHGEDKVPPRLEVELDVVVGQVTKIPFDPRR